MVAAAPSYATQCCTGAELLRWRRGLLAQGGSAAGLDWLLEMQAGLIWQDLQRLQLSPERTVTLTASLQELEAIWEQHRTTQKPLQYLVGRCPWRDLELKVAAGVLIPRQETELLVDLALGLFSPSDGRNSAPLLWADLGTGSGCLAVALARAWPESRGFAIDLSHAALTQVAANLRSHGLQEQVLPLLGSWWEPLRPHWGRLNLVLSNPPYIPTAVWKELEPLVREHEPKLALDGGNDGLAAIRAIAMNAAEALAPDGWLVLEHHHDHSSAVQQLLRDAGLEGVSAYQDLEGNARFAAARRPAP